MCFSPMCNLVNVYLLQRCSNNSQLFANKLPFRSPKKNQYLNFAENPCAVWLRIYPNSGSRPFILSDFSSDTSKAKGSKESGWAVITGLWMRSGRLLLFKGVEGTEDTLVYHTSAQCPVLSETLLSYSALIFWLDEKVWPNFNLADHKQLLARIQSNI